MADIKQAAKWMLEGKTVKRTAEKWVVDGLGKREDIHRVKVVLCFDDLLADDWEVAE